MTRDSVFFSWFTVATAIATYFATAGDPRGWDIAHWAQAIAAIGGIIAAKLGTSPLPGSADANTVKPAPPR